jgi:hypothetical protein
MPKDLTRRLAIFLLKDTLPSPEHAVDTTHAQQEAVSCGTVAATLYYKQAYPPPPAGRSSSWAIPCTRSSKH